MTTSTDAFDALAEQLEADLPRLLDEHRVPGGAVGVALGDQTFTAAAGVLDLGTGLPATTDSVFQLASTTKAWTATAVMRLVDEGLIELDTPVQRYLPEFRTSDAASSAKVTVRHLLSHTAGFDGEQLLHARGDTAIERYVRQALPRARTIFAPGRMFSYCNGGYTVLGHLIERVRGVPYAEALHRDLAEPLGLERFATGAAEAIALRPAIGHIGDEPTPSRIWDLPHCVAPAGALAMSVGDLLRFARMHLADGMAATGARVLTSRSVREMRLPQASEPAPIMAFAVPGLGWFVNPNGILGADGGGIGQRAFLRLVPEHRLAVAVMTNGSGGEAVGVPLLRKVIRVLADSDLGAPPSSTHSASVAPARVIGRYESEAGAFGVAMTDGGLRLDHERTEAETLTDLPSLSGVLRQTGNAVFDIEGPEGKAIDLCVFVFDEQGAAELLHIGGMAVPRVG